MQSLVLCNANFVRNLLQQLLHASDFISLRLETNAEACQATIPFAPQKRTARQIVALSHLVFYLSHNVAEMHLGNVVVILIVCLMMCQERTDNVFQVDVRIL